MSGTPASDLLYADPASYFVGIAGFSFFRRGCSVSCGSRTLNCASPDPETRGRRTQQLFFFVALPNPATRLEMYLVPAIFHRMIHKKHPKGGLKKKPRPYPRLIVNFSLFPEVA